MTAVAAEWQRWQALEAEVRHAAEEVLRALGAWRAAHGSQSEARALGVTLDVVRHQGGYAPGSMVPERKYIDPSCPPSAAGHVFFGWLRPLV